MIPFSRSYNTCRSRSHRCRIAGNDRWRSIDKLDTIIHGSSSRISHTHDGICRCDSSSVYPSRHSKRISSNSHTCTSSFCILSSSIQRKNSFSGHHNIRKRRYSRKVIGICSRIQNTSSVHLSIKQKF
jgi:hypothetical protein